MQNVFRRLLFHYWYFRKPPWDTGISPPELLEFIQTHQPGRALDVGCGTGTNLITLARAGWRVVGIDFAPRAVKLAKQKLKNANLQADLQVKDATKLDGISGPFDLVFDLGCFHGISKPSRAKYLDQVERVLAPGGFWLLYGFLNADSGDSSTGLNEAEISKISSRVNLVSRQDGLDRRDRNSAWFLFQKKTASSV